MALKRKLFDLEDRWFDLRNGIDTRGVIVGAQLQTASQWHGHATAYHAVWTRNIRALVRAGAQTGIHPRTFVDIGCGKGKACFYAARSGRFTHVCGIDFDESLIDAARQNLAASGRSDITFHHADAATYDIPPRLSFIFMFNPFDAKVLMLFLERNIESFKRHGHLIAYANDIQRSVLVDLGFKCVFSDQLRKLSLWCLA